MAERGGFRSLIRTSSERSEARARRKTWTGFAGLLPAAGRVWKRMGEILTSMAAPPSVMHSTLPMRIYASKRKGGDGDA